MFNALTRGWISRSPMLEQDIERVNIPEHLEEIKQVVTKLIGTELEPGNIDCISRLLEIHMSTGIYYSRRLANHYQTDVDIVTSDFVLGMIDACLRLHRREATPDNPTAYILSRGRSFVVNSLENGSTGWNRMTRRVAIKNGDIFPSVSTIDQSHNFEVFKGQGYSEDFHPSYIDDSIAIMIETEDLMHNLSMKQRDVLVLLAKGYTDREAASELGWGLSKLETVKAEIILIMERRIKRGRRPIS